ncbi:hypothetical protein V8C35DRAFT_258169 [Trichoderma chlorosporum]
MDSEEAQDSEDSRTEAESEFEYNPQLLCAAYTRPKHQCKKIAVIDCWKCRLVAYCSKQCKAKDSSNHSHTPDILPSYPQSTELETDKIPDHPFFETAATFWANYPATDILNLGNNEGLTFDGTLRLLLLGPFGLRHLIYSAVAMPRSANPLLDTTLHESEMPHLMRTFLSLILLSKNNLDSYKVADVVLHIWYSAKWPEWVYFYINMHAAHILLGLRQQIEDFYGDDEDKRTVCFGIRLGTPGYFTVDVCLDWYTWGDLLKCCFYTPDLDSAAREDDVSKYGEPLDRLSHTKPAPLTTALMKWRREGVLIPYGESSSDYTRANPALFLPGTGLPAGITNEPLSEWPMMEIMDYCPYPAKNDVYGKMNYYVREMIAAFRAVLGRRGMTVRLITCGLVEIAGHMRRYWRERFAYDRIEVGNCFDLEPRLCMLSCASLLRPSFMNVYATMLTMMRESSLHAESPETLRHVELEKTSLCFPAPSIVENLTPQRLAAGEQYNAAVLPRHICLVALRNWHLFTYQYLSSTERFGFQLPEDENCQQAKAAVPVTGFLGLVMKYNNTVAAKWPNFPGDGQWLNRERLKRFTAWPATRPQCWIEWKKMGGLTAREWLAHLEAAKGEKAVAIWKQLYDISLVTGAGDGGGEAAPDVNEQGAKEGQ